MSWTQTDLDNVSAAITELATGARVVKVRYPNGHEVEYGQTGIPTLKHLRAEIKAELNAAAGTPSHFVAVTGKGL